MRPRRPGSRPGASRGICPCNEDTPIQWLGCLCRSRAPRSQLAVDPCDERAPVELFGAACRARASLPCAELQLELRILLTQPQKADLLVEIGVLELLAQVRHHRLGALLGQLAVVHRAALRR